MALPNITSTSTNLAVLIWLKRFAQSHHCYMFSDTSTQGTAQRTMAGLGEDGGFSTRWPSRWFKEEDRSSECRDGRRDQGRHTTGSIDRHHLGLKREEGIRSCVTIPQDDGGPGPAQCALLLSLSGEDMTL
ncbi:hypothetical protein MBM_03546 [Drepanopeziza brunnea f. sp. 'multigermtubi' MB_m1]|uniref:Uncharacterized protein n=1 Tax=Marssonina brunnea f. sp. multigermtubi (strain MB_m1) TaxID=1072389 RepID=K1XCR2_MARBU|nr:uncharacterized protein MBM_03546 [Drepanopeziza brunnea f. sp. 'multigermtubi' MB_m1]EKD18553.1 hypothetical protein MBM_03546 [Drepanopeziza brunnea f. sp. 'multigermtubi' MB_m1]